MPTAYDRTTGWDFEYDDVSSRPPPGGLRLTNMHHWGHNFCKDLRLIGMRIWMSEIRPDGTVAQTTHQFLPLSDPPFVVSPQEVLTPTMVSATTLVGDITRFNTYFTANAFAIRCEYTLPATYVTATWPNCEFELMTVSQRFMFSPYGTSPRHEPSGGLQAARCHPMVRFHFQPNAAVDRTRNRWRLDKIRFDYRIHLFLDRSHTSPTAAVQIGNQAGLFRDEDTAYTVPVSQAGRTIVELGGRLFGGSPGVSAQGFSNAAFASIEKPLVLEVATRGLNLGADSDGDLRMWDNIHWWGARGRGMPMISAPGAFHAAHIHWRWGGAGASLRGTYPEIDGGGSRVRDRVQVDPNCWMQSIRVATTLHDPTLDPSTTGVTLESLCREDWPTLFTRHHATPTNIEHGADIVLWYSAEVHREVSYRAGGSPVVATLVTPATVFLHGIFFAHEAEQTSVTTPIGPTTAEYRPRSRATIVSAAAWERLP